MAGTNQHYIPQFLLKAFEIPGSDRRIWHFGLGEHPHKRAVRRTASERLFYSESDGSGDGSLDAAISARESKDLSKILNTVRSTRPGESMRAEDAALLAAHLTQRTSHVRSTLRGVVDRLLGRFAGVFGGRKGVDVFMGLNSTVPSARFREMVMDELPQTAELEQLGLSRRTLERIAFIRAKERADDAVQNLDVGIGGLRAQLTGRVRRTHNRALKESTIETSEHEAALQAFDWTVERGPERGAILPDCVAIAVGPDGRAGNHLLVGVEATEAMVLAVSPDLLLVGRRQSFVLPKGFDYNLEAACLSHAFFLAPRKDEETLRLHSMIGTELQPSIAEVVERSLEEALPMPSKEPPLPADGLLPLRPGGQRSPLRYKLAFAGYGDEGVRSIVRKLVGDIVEEFARVWPLNRLDGITIGKDYAGILKSVERGWKGAPDPSTVPLEIGKGFAQTLTVKRSGTAKGHIVLSSLVLDALLSKDKGARDWALHVISRQLAHVLLMELMERRLPGTLLKPAVTTELDAWLHRIAGGTPGNYMTSLMATGFGGSEKVAAEHREQLAELVGRLATVVVRERLAYREHGDLNKLLGIAMPTIEHVLSAAADLLGHCAGCGASPLAEACPLRDALDRAGLLAWLGVYGDDLARMHGRLGRWESFDEFLAFNIHAERLLMAVGMFAQDSPQGVKITVPSVAKGEGPIFGMPGGAV